VPLSLPLLQALLARQYFCFLQRITPMLRVLFLLLVCTVELYFFIFVLVLFASLIECHCVVGMFAFSPLIWQYAVTAEVFPLNTLLASVIVYLTVAFSQTGSLTVSHVGALMCGLALCNQHTIILFEVPLILWMLFLLRNKMLENKLYIASHVGLTLFGLSAYSYLPVVATLTPKAGSW
jgi:hypothetical protein